MNKLSLLTKHVLIIFCCIHYSCDSNKSQKLETDKLDERQDNSAKIYRPINKKKTLKLEITKSEGVSVVLGKHFEFYDADLVESDSTPNSGGF